MKSFQQIREATSGRRDVKCSGEKSQFGGFTAVCKRGSITVYSSQQSYKDAQTAKKHAEVYADNYYSGGDRQAQFAVRKFVASNKDKLYTKKESVEEGYKSPAEAQAIADGKKAARQGKKYADNPHKKGTPEFTAWSKGHNMARESVELDEGMDAQLDRLKKAFADLDKINVTGPAYKKAKQLIKGMSKEELTKLAKTKVKFLSQMAASELRLTHNVKLKASEYMGEEVDEKYRTPTAAEIEADKKKDRRGKSRPSASYKSIKNKMYKNAMGGLKDD